MAASTLGSGTNHGSQKWSGQWDFEHLDASGAPNGVRGGFAFRHETDENGATLLTQIGGAACTEPTDYFAGGYTLPDGTPPAPALPPGEFVDTGKIRACTVGGDPKHVQGRYESNGSGGSGNIDLVLGAGDASWSGTFTVDGQPGVFQWRGTFDKHFEDGADDPSTPLYGSGPTTVPANRAAARRAAHEPRDDRERRILRESGRPGSDGSRLGEGQARIDQVRRQMRTVRRGGARTAGRCRLSDRAQGRVQAAVARRTHHGRAARSPSLLRSRGELSGSGVAQVRPRRDLAGSRQDDLRSRRRQDQRRPDATLARRLSRVGHATGAMARPLRVPRPRSAAA